MRNIVTCFFQSPKRLLLSGSMALGFLFFALLPATALAAPQKCGDNDVKCVIQFGDEQINNRIAALNKLDTAITNQHDKHTIDDAHADALHADVKTNIDGLNALKTKLDAETDAKAARQDVDKIYTQFRIYAVVLPRDYRRLHLAIEITVDNKLNAAKPAIEKLINNASADKKDQLNKLYSDYKDQLADAEKNIDLAQQTWPLLTPESYNTDRATYTTNLKNLTTYVQTAHADLHKAAADLHQIRQTLKAS